MGYVMIVDDDEDLTVAMAEVLRLAGHEVRVEPQTAGALKSMAARRPDLVILDVMFPQGISAGFELARTMRHESATLKEIPIVMLTAVGQRFPFGFGPPDLEDGSLPVDSYIEKPVDPDVLAATVANLLRGARPSEGSRVEGRGSSQITPPGAQSFP